MHSVGRIANPSDTAQPESAVPARLIERPAAEAVRFADRWNLRLAPEALPALDESVFESAWIWHGPSWHSAPGPNHEVLRFLRDRDGGGEVEITVVQTDRMGKASEWTGREPLRIERSLMELRGRLHTVCLDRENLIKNVCIPFDERKWYGAYSEHYPNGVRTVEYLFDFEDDPTANRNGRATVHYHVRNSWEPEGRERRLSATFEVTHVLNESRRLKLRHEHRPGEGAFNIPELRFPEGATHIEFQSEPVVRARIYRPVRE